MTIWVCTHLTTKPRADSPSLVPYASHWVGKRQDLGPPLKKPADRTFLRGRGLFVKASRPALKPPLPPTAEWGVAPPSWRSGSVTILDDNVSQSGSIILVYSSSIGSGC